LVRYLNEKPILRFYHTHFSIRKSSINGLVLYLYLIFLLEAIGKNGKIFQKSERGKALGITGAMVLLSVWRLVTERYGRQGIARGADFLQQVVHMGVERQSDCEGCPSDA
jgi:hypothetical protein